MTLRQNRNSRILPAFPATLVADSLDVSNDYSPPWTSFPDRKAGPVTHIKASPTVTLGRHPAVRHRAADASSKPRMS